MPAGEEESEKHKTGRKDGQKKMAEVIKEERRDGGKEEKAEKREIKVTELKEKVEGGVGGEKLDVEMKGGGIVGWLVEIRAERIKSRGGGGGGGG